MFQYIDQFPKKSILVVGDVMLDLYIRGEVERISPEAPVLVVLETSRQVTLGGAANVANNIKALGAKVSLFGVIGKDMEGELIEKTCRAGKINSHLVVDSERMTTTKTRALARHHHLLRIDRENKTSLSPAIEKKIVSEIKNLPKHDLVVVSDYNKGFFTKNIIQALEKRFGKNKIVANFKPANSHLFKNILALTHNVKEAKEITNIFATDNKFAGKVALALGKKFSSSIILTRGDRGMTLLEKKFPPIHIPARATKVMDVTGASDTVISVLSLMLACESSLVEAAKLANFAAGLVVGLEGTATISIDYLKNSLINEKENI